LIVNIVRYRGYIWRNSVAELRHRYAGSGLGLFWLVLYPLAQIAVFSLVFSGIMQARLPGLAELPFSFTLYLCAGLLPWIGFSEIVTRSTSTLLTHASTVTSAAIPEQIFFSVDAVAGYLTMLVGMALLLGAALLVGLEPSLAWVSLPGILALLVVFAFGLGMGMGVLNVFSRDVSQVVSILLQISLWTAPIVYAESILSDRLRSLLPYNPLYSFVSSLHDAVLFGTAPTPTRWLAMMGVGVLAMLGGYALLRWLRPELRDAL
jgi:lipopolysaccharide transport system permease protein